MTPKTSQRRREPPVMSCAVLIQGSLAPGVLLPGVAYRVAEIREHWEPSPDVGVEPTVSTVVRFDPLNDSDVDTLRDRLNDMSHVDDTDDTGHRYARAAGDYLADLAADAIDALTLAAAAAHPAPEGLSAREAALADLEATVRALSGSESRLFHDAISRVHVLDHIAALRAATLPESTVPAALDVELLDRTLNDLMERGWITLPSGHGVQTIRSVFMEAHARLAAATPPASPETEDDEAYR